MASTEPPLVPRDTREGERWTLLQSAKNHAIYAAVRTLLLLLRPLPAAWLPPLGRSLGVALYLLGIGPRSVALSNLALAYPALSHNARRALAGRSYQQLGSYLGEAVAALLHPASFVPLQFEDGSREVLAAAMQEGRGVVFASAHLGPWERLAGSLVHHGFPLTTLARESYDPRFMTLYEQLRGGHGVAAIYRGSASAPLQIVRTLRRGALLGAPMDLKSRVPSVDAALLGIPASTPVGPARIALRTQAAVVVGTPVPVAGSPALVIRVARVATEGLVADEEGERVLTERLNDELSARIRAFPEAWVWMHPRWGGRPRRAQPPSFENCTPAVEQTA